MYWRSGWWWKLVHEIETQIFSSSICSSSWTSSNCWEQCRERPTDIWTIVRLNELSNINVNQHIEDSSCLPSRQLHLVVHHDGRHHGRWWRGWGPGWGRGCGWSPELRLETWTRCHCTETRGWDCREDDWPGHVWARDTCWWSGEWELDCDRSSNLGQSGESTVMRSWDWGILTWETWESGEWVESSGEDSSGSCEGREDILDTGDLPSSDLSWRSETWVLMEDWSWPGTWAPAWWWFPLLPWHTQTRGHWSGCEGVECSPLLRPGSSLARSSSGWRLLELLFSTSQNQHQFVWLCCAPSHFSALSWTS